MSGFDHDRMPAYRLAREFNSGCAELVRRLGAGRGDLADQLRRASASVSLNIAEGAGEYSRKEKARFYRMARRSATECAAILDALVDAGQLPNGDIVELRELDSRVVGMLVRLAKAVEGDARDGLPSRRQPEGEGGGERR